MQQKKLFRIKVLFEIKKKHFFTKPDLHSTTINFYFLMGTYNFFIKIIYREKYDNSELF